MTLPIYIDLFKSAVLCKSTPVNSENWMDERRRVATLAGVDPCRIRFVGSKIVWGWPPLDETVTWRCLRLRYWLNLLERLRHRLCRNWPVVYTFEILPEEEQS